MTAFWVEISVEADPEAVEAVSEILGRVAPTGTSVEPGFELVDEGLGARPVAGKPAVVRAYVEATDPEALLKLWLPGGLQGLGQMQEALWKQFMGGFSAAAAPDDKKGKR